MLGVFGYSFGNSSSTSRIPHTVCLSLNCMSYETEGTCLFQTGSELGTINGLIESGA